MLGLIGLFFLFHLGLVVISHLTGRHSLLGTVSLLNLDSESSVATWYSILTLAASSILLIAIYRHHSVKPSRFSVYWLVLGLIFLFLSIDEACSIHEKITKGFLSYGIRFGLVHGQWAVVYGTLMVVLFLFLLPFLKYLNPPLKLRFFVAGAVFVSGAIGMNILGGFFRHWGILVYHIFTGIEEVLEMIGIALFIRALLLYIHEERVSLSVRFLAKPIKS